MQLANLAGVIVFVLVAVVFCVGVYAFVHAAMQRPDAYTADRQAHQAGVAGDPREWRCCWPCCCATRSAPPSRACATGIYLVDVRPKLLEIQGKSR